MGSSPLFFFLSSLIFLLFSIHLSICLFTFLSSTYRSLSLVISLSLLCASLICLFSLSLSLMSREVVREKEENERRTSLFLNMSCQAKERTVNFLLLAFFSPRSSHFKQSWAWICLNCLSFLFQRKVSFLFDRNGWRKQESDIKKRKKMERGASLSRRLLLLSSAKGDIHWDRNTIHRRKKS